MANLISLGNLVIDCDRYDASIGGRQLGLTFAEFELLLCLARKADKVVHREELLRALWGDLAEDRSEVLRVHVSRLRKKLADSDPYIIRCVLRRGYALSGAGRLAGPPQQSSGPLVLAGAGQE